MRFISLEGPVSIAWLIDDLSSSGIVGDPTQADARVGMRIVERWTERLLGGLREIAEFRFRQSTEAAGERRRIQKSSSTEQLYTVTILVDDAGALEGGFAALVTSGVATNWNPKEIQVLTGEVCCVDDRGESRDLVRGRVRGAAPCGCRRGDEARVSEAGGLQ